MKAVATILLVSFTTIGCERPAGVCSLASLDSLVASGNAGLVGQTFELPTGEPLARSAAEVWFAGQNVGLITAHSAHPEGQTTDRYFIIDSLNFAFDRYGATQERIHVCDGRAIDGTPAQERAHLSTVAARLHMLDSLFPKKTAELARRQFDTSLASRLDTIHGPEGTYGDAPLVIVTVGQARFALGTDTRFADSAARMLPKPGVVADSDAHSDAHGDNRFCWSFPGGYFTLFDNDWGLTTIDIYRRAAPASAHCPAVTEAPVVEMSGRRLSLASTPSDLAVSLFPHFKRSTSGMEADLEGKWWNFTRRRKDNHVVCAMDYLYVTHMAKDGALQTLGIIKTGEGMSVRAQARYRDSPDSTYSCS